MIKTEGQDADIGRCREAVDAFVRAHGAAPKACVVTFGCQMNARDSEKLSGILLASGHELVETEDGAV